MNEDFQDQVRGEAGGWRGRWHQWRAELYHSNPIVRQLVHEPLFRWVVLLVLGAGLAAAVLLPKLWNPAPEGFSRSVRVSLLDYGQAWALQRSARQAMAEGRWEASLLAWRQAIANNEANPALHRGLLEMLRRAPWARTENLVFVMHSGATLLELTQTNRSEIVLLADVLERHRLADFAADLLRHHETDFTPDEDRVWMRTLLTLGKVAPFRARWNADPSRYESDPVLRLYRTAVDAGWGSAQESLDGFAKLHAALEAPEQRLVAARMLCAAASAHDDVDEYQRGLAALRSLGSAVVPDEVGGWQLLARVGRKDEALAAAQAYDRIPPPTAFEMVQLARGWAALGLDQKAVEMLDDHAAIYQGSREVWGCFLDLLVQRKDWNGVRRIAARLRANAGHRDDLRLVTLYADARADLAENRRVAAQESLKRIRETELSNPELLFRVAIGLRQLSEFATSGYLLEKLEPKLGSFPEYWAEVGALALARRDVAGLRKAAERWVQLSPTDARALALQLTALLGARENSAEALAISYRLRSGGATAPGMQLQYAQALLANRRTPEAVQMLAEIPLDRLSPADRAGWWLAQFEARVQSGQLAEALETVEKLDANLLLPPQEAWFRQAVAECRKAVPSRPNSP